METNTGQGSHTGSSPLGSNHTIHNQAEGVTHSRLRDLFLVIEQEDPKEIAARARSMAIDGHVLWNTELVRLEAAQQQVDKLVTTVQRSALPCPAKVCLDD